MCCLIGWIIAIFIIILWALYNMCPNIIPEKFWTYKSWRSFDRFNNKIIRAVKENMVPYSDPDVISGPIVSYYQKFDKEKHGTNAIVVGFHYTNWCGYCNRMKPVWEAVKKNITEDPSGKFSAIKLIENDEQINPTAGINSYPTIIKYRKGKAVEYKGLADYNQLREFILAVYLDKHYV